MATVASLAEGKLSLDPFTMEVTPLAALDAPPSLLQACMATVHKLVGLARIQQIATLEIPKQLISRLMMLGINHFHIDPSDLTAELQHQQVFPATCLLDNSHVHLYLYETDPPPGREFGLLATFRCNGILVCVHEVTETLHELIHRSRAGGQPLEEPFVWTSLLQLAQTIAAGMAPEEKVTPKALHLRDGQIHYRPPGQDNNQQRPPDSAVYDSPEGIDGDPLTTAALAWRLGCVAYEMAALTPAFCDRDGSGDIFGVMMDMVEGVPPPPLPDTCSPQLKAVIDGCLLVDPTQRMTIAQVIEAASSNIAEQ